MTLLADSPAARQGRRAYRGPGDAGAGPAAVCGPVLPANRTGAARDRARTVRSWPLLLLAFPAAAEVWSGWVGIAQKTGFGLVSPLPPPSCPACRSWSWPWGPRWPTCSATTPRTRTPATAGPQDQAASGPRTGPAGTSLRTSRTRTRGPGPRGSFTRRGPAGRHTLGRRQHPGPPDIRSLTLRTGRTSRRSASPAS
jgi:hypothetical protein